MNEQLKVQAEAIIEDLNRIQLLIKNDKKQMSLDLLKYVIEDIKIILKRDLL
jgi:hypothetical protein